MIKKENVVDGDIIYASDLLYIMGMNHSKCVYNSALNKERGN